MGCACQLCLTIHDRGGFYLVHVVTCVAELEASAKFSTKRSDEYVCVKHYLLTGIVHVETVPAALSETS